MALEHAAKAGNPRKNRGKPHTDDGQPEREIAEDSSRGVIRAGRGQHDPEALREAIQVVLELAEKRGPIGDRQATALRIVAEAAQD